MYFEELKASILKEDDLALKWLYSNFKLAFVEWAIKVYSVEKEMALDVFQEAVVIFYYNIKQGKVLETGVSVKTYLFAIGKNTLMSQLRKNRLKFTSMYDVQLEDQKWNLGLFEVDDDQHRIVKLIDTLGSICRQLLRLFYFDNNSMEAIAIKMKYKNENVAKTQKMRCLKELKQLVVKRNT